MIHLNIKFLRTNAKLTQEELAERINVSRQVIAKWEKGESTPDLTSCLALSKLFNVTIDNLVTHNSMETAVPIPPKGKHYFGVTKLGEDGQIVIPEKAREVFGIEPGHTLIFLGDEDRGLAIVPEKYVNSFLNVVKSPMDDY